MFNKISIFRYRFLHQIAKYRQEGRPIIYTDETYINSSHTTLKKWTDQSNLALKTPIGKGRRLIIVHAGSESGFVPNALLIFKSGQKSGDYHNDMNYENYKKWITEKLIPNLPENSVIVVDNASYHNFESEKQPTLSWTKGKMREWLDARGIPYSQDDVKIMLYEKIKLKKGAFKRYAIDEVFAGHGHTVLRLPPYHPELNPIEKIWGIVKNWVATKNISFNLDDIKKLAEEKFQNISSDIWNNVCEHSKKIEENMMSQERILDNICDTLIINADSSDEDSTAEDEENVFSDSELL